MNACNHDFAIRLSDPVGESGVAIYGCPTCDLTWAQTPIGMVYEIGIGLLSSEQELLNIAKTRLPRESYDFQC